MVFSHHAFQIPLMWAGVDLFFIISGYLITGILLRDRERMSFRTMLGRFYIRRVERILPAYILFLLFAYPFVKTEWSHLWGYYVGFLQNVPYAFGFIGFSPLVPLWSLAVEQHFYLVWPPLVYFLPRKWLVPCMCAVLFGTPVLRALCTPLFSMPEPIYALTPFRLDAMAAGALAALCLPHCRSRITIRWAQLSMALAFITYVFLGIHPWFRRTANTPAFNGLAYSLNIIILGGLFVWAVLSSESVLNRVLSNRLLRGLGRISYMFYLLYLGVLLIATRYYGRIGGAAMAFVVTTALATLSWFAIERPILSLSASHRRASLKAPVQPG